MIKWFKDILKQEVIEEIEEEVKIPCSGCEACNYEGFYRDYDGSWLRDCYK